MLIKKHIKMVGYLGILVDINNVRIAKAIFWGKIK